MELPVSVIIPIYRSEQYLERCIDSVIGQSYSNLEIILVDDGSPDNCPAICDKYAQIDSRIKVIHKINGGASSARNAGLDLASGEYVCFVDSDDVLLPDSIENLYLAANDTVSQYAAGMCRYMGKNAVKYKIKNQMVLDIQESPETFLEYITSPGSYSPYAKIFRLDVLNNYNIRYDENLKCSEDALFIRQYLTYCKRICFVPFVVYDYNTGNDNSLSKKGYENFSRYFSAKMNALECLVSVLPLSEERRKEFLNERAVHGLKISIDHYFLNFSNVEKQKDLVINAIDVLLPWLCISPLHKKFYLYKWWKLMQKYIKERDFNVFFEICKGQFQRKTFIYRVKSLIKRILKGKRQ